MLKVGSHLPENPSGGVRRSIDPPRTGIRRTQLTILVKLASTGFGFHPIRRLR
jgi:hypothetical protein